MPQRLLACAQALLRLPVLRDVLRHSEQRLNLSRVASQGNRPGLQPATSALESFDREVQDARPARHHSPVKFGKGGPVFRRDEIHEWPVLHLRQGGGFEHGEPRGVHLEEPSIGSVDRYALRRGRDDGLQARLADAQRRVLAGQEHPLMGVLERRRQPREVASTLGDVVVRPRLQGLHGGFLGAHDHDRHGQGLLADLAKQLEGVPIGQAQVSEHHVEGSLAAQPAAGFREGRRDLDRRDGVAAAELQPHEVRRRLAVFDVEDLHGIPFTALACSG